jgi:TolB-like protein
MASPTVEAFEAQQQLERILASAVFRKAQRSQRFLRYLVEFSLTQPAASIKEYAVALDVFDRAADYNPTIDATVRVEASRLRQRLREYYEQEGQDDIVLISVPKGSYQAVIYRRPAVQARSGHSDVLETSVPPSAVTQTSDVQTAVEKVAEASAGSTLAAAAKLFTRRPVWILLVVAGLLLTAGTATVFLRPTQSASPGPLAIRSLAVLPLKDLSAQPNPDYFDDGIIRGVIADLSSGPNLQVVSGSSIARLDDTPASLTKAARTLGVDAIVYGSVLRSNDQVTIHLQLFDARSNHELWAAKFSDGVTNLASLDSLLATEIASHAMPNAAFAPAKIAAEKPIDPSAYDGYLQGRYLLSKRDLEGSVKMFRRAVVLDPGYARSWAGLSAGLCELAMYSDPKEGFVGEAKAAARHAIDLDPGNGEAWSVLGEIAFNLERDWKGADYDLRRATALSPNDSTTESRYAIFLSMVGRPDEAVRHMQRALALDPLSFFNVRLMGSVLYWSRRYDESLEYLQKAREIEPELAVVITGWEVDDYQMKGMLEQAVATDLHSLDVKDPKKWHDVLEEAYRRGGREAYWKSRIKSTRNNTPGPCALTDPARIEIFAGEKDHALEDLNRALEAGCFWLSALKAEPIFDVLKDDPRYKQMLRKVKLSD